MTAPCVACGGETAPLYDAVEDFYFRSGHAAAYVHCLAPRCLTVQHAARPAAEAVGAFYGAYYTHASLGLGKRLERQAGARLQALRLGATRAAHPTPMPRPILEGSNVPLDLGGVLPGRGGAVGLDVGCGNGETMVMLASFGYARVLGVEMDPAACASSAALGFEVRPGSAEALPYPDGSADVVFLRHVIEHVLDPDAALAEALRVLRPGGLLSLLTPNAAGARHLEFGAHWRGLESPRHLQIFTAEGLASLVTKAGATVLEAGTNARSAAWIARLSRACRDEAGAAARPPTDAFRALARGHGEGDEVFVIARREA